MKPVDAVNEGGCYAGADNCKPGTAKWRIENCVVGDIVADAVFSYHIENADSEFLYGPSDLRVSCTAVSLTFTVDETGEEVKVDGCMHGFVNGRRDVGVFCSVELPDGFPESLVFDAVDQFTECSMPLVRRHAWESHPRNPANAVEQSASTRRVTRDTEAGI